MRKWTYLIAALAMTSFTVGASAATMSLDLKPGFYQPVTINYLGNNEYVYAGPFTISLTGSDVPASYPTTFDGFCVDLADWISVPTSYDVNLRSTDDLVNGGAAAWLYNQFGTDAYGQMYTTQDEATALQIAIWKGITDAGTPDATDLSSGNFQYTTPGNVLDLANGYLSTWCGQSDTATWLMATVHTNNTNQDMIGPPIVPTTGPPAVPEPGVSALLGSGLIGAMTLIRRRRRK